MCVFCELILLESLNVDEEKCPSGCHKVELLNELIKQYHNLRWQTGII